ncbi:GNAT family N-acetyltransferase [Thioalkalivibrio denitrificans]|uniref:GNAT family N-acetyltransferase n=1 Tax=Thioalkalivibrio denitrificans TaxID=108003 RepID=A0A1V3NUR7_9GAMM|nr:GNAT family N-acetyltransferase [Thioalkalivibrio denitrificans]OOG28714.1 GNAT family N-acetyltransferase [Thioalkalivibrio denitrificans]
MSAEIRIAETDDEIAACFPVIHALRPHLSEPEFVPLIRRMEAGAYRLAYLAEHGRPVAVAGFRIGENLPWGRFMYVDDLVTDPAHRSRGHGRTMLSWLKRHAAEAGCGQLRLDSGVQRKDAHRFYEREGMEMVSLHFMMPIPGD